MAKGIDVRATVSELLFRVLLQDAAGAIVTSGTTSLRLYELQMSDGSLKSYDFNDNTFKATTCTTETASMTHRAGNNGGTNTGVWSYRLATLTGFTVGNIYFSHITNTGATPVVQVREWQFGSEQGDVVLNGVYPEVDVRQVAGTTQTAGDLAARLPAALTAEGNIKADALKLNGSAPNNLAVGAQMDLVSAPNATAVLAIQNGLAKSIPVAEARFKTDVNPVVVPYACEMGTLTDLGYGTAVCKIVSGKLQFISTNGGSLYGDVGVADGIFEADVTLDSATPGDSVGIVFRRSGHWGQSFWEFFIRATDFTLTKVVDLVHTYNVISYPVALTGTHHISCMAYGSLMVFFLDGDLVGYHVSTDMMTNTWAGVRSNSASTNWIDNFSVSRLNAPQTGDAFSLLGTVRGVDNDTLKTLSDQVDAVQAKTVNLPSDPADESNVLAAIAGVVIPSVGAIADAVWDELMSGHLTTGSVGKALSDTDALPTASEIAAAMVAVLTQLGNTSVDGTNRTVVRGDTWSLAFTDLGDLSAVTDIWFTAKISQSQLDSEALLKVSKTAGLLTWNGSSTGLTASNASLVVTDAVSGDITITVKPAQTVSALLEMPYFDVQIKYTDGRVATPATACGRLFINADVTRELT
jgi:hypothetical protein